jgi:hypothetical protein
MYPIPAHVAGELAPFAATALLIDRQLYQKVAVISNASERRTPSLSHIRPGIPRKYSCRKRCCYRRGGGVRGSGACAGHGGCGGERVTSIASLLNIRSSRLIDWFSATKVAVSKASKCVHVRLANFRPVRWCHHKDDGEGHKKCFLPTSRPSIRRSGGFIPPRSVIHISHSYSTSTRG